MKKNITGLSDDLKLGIENLSGHSMDSVKVHYNSAVPEQIKSEAYSQGKNIHIGLGQEQHLPNETWHVVQQKDGKIKSILSKTGKASINDDHKLEDEANTMGSKALQMKSD